MSKENEPRIPFGNTLDSPFAAGIAFHRIHRHTMKKSTIGIVLGLLLLTSCGNRDKKLEQQVAGTWTTDDGCDVWKLSAGGVFDEKYSDPPRGYTFQGTWEVKDGWLIQTIAKVSSTNIHHLAPVGTVNRSQIVKVSRTNLILELEGQTDEWIRKR